MERDRMSRSWCCSILLLVQTINLNSSTFPSTVLPPSVAALIPHHRASHHSPGPCGELRNRTSPTPPPPPPVLVTPALNQSRGVCPSPVEGAGRAGARPPLQLTHTPPLAAAVPVERMTTTPPLHLLLLHIQQVFQAHRAQQLLPLSCTPFPGWLALRWSLSFSPAGLHGQIEGGQHGRKG